MALPERLIPQKPDAQQMAKFKQLLAQIEHEIAVHSDDENYISVYKLILEWNTLSARPFEFHEFRDFHSWIDEDDFIHTAVYRPKYIDDITFDEIAAIADFLGHAEGTESEQGYALELLDMNFKDANVSSLIYWPNEWFKDDTEMQIELSSHEIANYIHLRSNRKLNDVPDIPVRFSMPQ